VASIVHGHEGNGTNPALFEKIGPEEMTMKITTFTGQTMRSVVLAAGLTTVRATEAPPPEQTALTPPPSAEAPVAGGVASGVAKGTDLTTNQEVSAETIYNSLARHGEWYYQAAFGWCWQPRSWLDELDNDSHVWSALRYGSWNNSRTRGWCWVPSPQLRMSSYLQDVDDSRGKRVSSNNGAITSGLDADSFYWQPVSQFACVSGPIVIGYGATGVPFSYFAGVHSSFGGNFYRGGQFGFRGGFHGAGRGGFHGGGGFHHRGGFHGHGGRRGRF
jgi:hypothetical protein